MRFVFLVLSLSIAIAAHAQGPDSDYNATDMSSNWPHEKGAHESAEERSKTAQFLGDMGMTLLKATPAPATAEIQDTSTGTH